MERFRDPMTESFLNSLQESAETRRKWAEEDAKETEAERKARHRREDEEGR